ncbi:MAG TPA: hypothetical protein P5239_09070 [Victivallales bacterium]|mgnify:CR=1 FL=1|jgi:hypothetical protein|nr:hypothetical protein [Victivallales bacterium]
MDNKLKIKSFYEESGINEEDLKFGVCRWCMLEKDDVHKYANMCVDCINESNNLHKKLGKELLIAFVVIISVVCYFIIYG